MSELFSIQLQNRQQQGGDGVWLDLPTTTERVQAALRQIGISSDNPQGLFISGYFAEEEKRFAIPYNMVLASNVDELNFLASRLETLSTGERAELNAALQVPQSELFSIGRITDFPENVDYYVHLPDVHGPAQLGDYYLNRSGMVDMPEEWKGGIDTVQFGRYVAQQEQGAFTQYGYLVKSGDEWQKVHEGQPVPEEYRVLSFPVPEVMRDAANIPPPVQPETEPQKVIPIILNGKDSVERMKEITDRLETGIQQLFDSDRYKAYLTTMAKFHNYSFNNTLLIAMQGGQLVAGFNKWKDTFHRTVKKGEKGIKILAPAPYKVKQKMEKLDEQGKPILDKDGKPLTEEKTVQIPAFKVVSVFDVSQTEGEPLPSIAVNELSGSVQDYQDFFKALEQASPVPIGFEDIEGGAHGYFHLLDNRIAIQEGMSQLQTIKTAIHEIAHAKLHAIDPTDPEQTNRPDSRTREVQAESVAYAVCQHYGLDTSEYSFGYVAGWSSGRELAELKASLEIIRNAAHELISALDEHLAELRQQREADLSAAQEAAFALDNGNTLFIQTCDSGYDYTLYGPDHTALDGGQLDAPGLTLPDAGQEALNLLGQTAKVSEVLLGDKLAVFQEAAEKANEIPEPVKIPDPAAEPTVTILWSESDKLQDGEIMPLSVANRVFEELDTAQHTDREKDGYTGGWYDKTAFRIDFTLNGQPDNYEGRQDFGDGGNLYELDYQQHFQHIRDAALPVGANRLIYESGMREIGPKEHFNSRSDKYFGEFVRYEMQPRDPELLQAAIRQEQRSREPARPGDFKEHLAALHTGLIEAEAQRIAADMKRLAAPNSPDKNHFMVEVSPYFTKLASCRDSDQLLAMLPYKSLHLSSVKDRFGIYALIDKNENRDKCIRKPRTSVRKQLSETKQAASPKKEAARSKQHEMEV